VLQLLVSLQHDVRDMKQQLSHTACMLQEFQGERQSDHEHLELPVGVHLPATSEADIAAIEAALDDTSFRRQLVIT